MYYLLITISTFIFSIQFMFNERYQKESGGGWNASCKLSLYSSIVGLVALFIINKFRLEMSLISVSIATLYAVIRIGLNASTVKAFEYANLSVYSVFAMIGGMVLPFIYGIFFGEEVKMIQIVCVILISISVLINHDKGENSKKAFKYYMAVFILNGMTGVVSKFHQSSSFHTVDSASFLMLANIIAIVFSIVLITIDKAKCFTLSAKGLAYSAGGALLNSVANLILLFTLVHLPASVQYPIITGGVIVFSTVIDLFRKVNIRKKEVAAALIAFISSILMAI